MFDEIPVQAWLLFLILVVAYRPASYIHRYWRNAPSWPSQLNQDFSWRTPRALALNLVSVAGLLGLAVFILTDAARQLARAPVFWPALSATFGAWALTTVIDGLKTGHIEPLVRGLESIYERKGQPKRFWAALAWNAVLGCLFIWLAFETYNQAQLEALRDRCRGFDASYAPKEGVAACSELLAQRGPKHDQIAAEAYLYRGLIYLDTGRFDAAIADFTRLHELRPTDPLPLANRGMSYAWNGETKLAKRDFASVRAADPSHIVLHRGEALLSLTAGDAATAVVHLTTALKQNPNDRWSLRMRAEAYRWLGEHRKSETDASRLKALNDAKSQQLSPQPAAKGG